MSDETRMTLWEITDRGLQTQKTKQHSFEETDVCLSLYEQKNTVPVFIVNKPLNISINT